MVNESQSSEPFKGLVILLVCVVAVWAFYLVGMLYVSDRWDTRSNFGESFGAIEALFSGLAFAGLIFTIHLQRKELQLQREELRLARDELQRTASAQERSEISLKQQSETMLFTARLNAMIALKELKMTLRGSSNLLGPQTLEQIRGFITQTETEFAALEQQKQHSEDTPDAP